MFKLFPRKFPNKGDEAALGLLFVTAEVLLTDPCSVVLPAEGAFVELAPGRFIPLPGSFILLPG